MFPSHDLRELVKGFKKIPSFRVKKLEGKGGTAKSGYVPFHKQGTNHGTNTNTGGTGQHQGSATQAQGKHGTTSTTASKGSSNGGEKNVVPLVGFDNGKSDTQRFPSPIKSADLTGSPDNPFGDAKYVEGVDFQSLAMYGCGWCRDSIDFSEPGITLYPERHLALCPKCGTNHTHQTKVYVASV